VTPSALRTCQALTTGLVLVSAAAGVGTLVPGMLTGPAVMNGSARGTAIVVLAVAVPLVIASSRLYADLGSVRAGMVWLGAAAYLTYNAVLLALATPFNPMFLAYVAMLGLALWTMVALVAGLEDPAYLGTRGRARGVAVYIGVVAALNALAWLAAIVPALGADRPGSFLDGTGLITNPIHVQDLAFWLPAMALAACWLWQGRPRGVLLAGAGLVFWSVEALGVALDQVMGHHADPASDVASLGGALLFAVLFVVGLIPLGLLLGGVVTPHPQGADHDVAGRR
jgi:hypothetical protein